MPTPWLSSQRLFSYWMIEPGFWKFHEISWNFMKFHWNFKPCDRTLKFGNPNARGYLSTTFNWKSMRGRVPKFHSWKFQFLKFPEISWNFHFLKGLKSWNFMKFHVIRRTFANEIEPALIMHANSMIELTTALFILNDRTRFLEISWNFMKFQRLKFRLQISG